jgi:hypothetical protein
VVSISTYLLVDDVDNPDPTLSTARTEEELREIVTGMNEIWTQARIELDLRFVGRVAVPEQTLLWLMQGDLRAFFDEIGAGVALPSPSHINAFYVREIGGPNGISSVATRTFFVMDEPSVHDRRVSSHEVGHLLGLHHVLDDANRLLFSGTNGMKLSVEEATTARYAAQGILNGLR